MLTSLHIKNLALMEDASVELEKPSIALIGETGAGKSLIVESLSLLFGARADYSFVRDREKKASVSALFVLKEEFLSRFPHLQEVIEEDHTLLLERVLCPDKSSRYLINGQLYPLSQYRHIIDHLIDIHSQKSHSDILDEEKQLLYIDRYGKERLQKVKTQFQESYEKYQEAKKELKDFEEQNKELDTDYLSFQLEEIDRYQLKENEIEDLEEELRSIKDLTQVQNRYEELQEILSSSEPSFEEQLSQVERSLRSLMNAKPLEESAKECLLSLRTFTSSLHNVKDMYESLAIDENRIDAINERLFSLKNLQRKYGKSSAEILKKRDDFAKKLLDFGDNGLKIIDFSEVPSDILPLITGLLGRVVFTLQQWMLEEERHPIALFCDEAHLYLPTKTNDSIEEKGLHNFERIAKEGRKYGVALVVISQRPSDVSKTILSQCGNYIAMRLTNPEDQNVIKKLFPDNLGDFSELLPILDVGEALVVGDASLLPSRVIIDKPEIKPRSATVNFWDEWSIKKDVKGIEKAVESIRLQRKI